MNKRSLDYAATEEGSRLVDCPRCKGEGEVYPPVPIGFGLQSDPESCGWCMGAGRISDWWANQYHTGRWS